MTKKLTDQLAPQCRALKVSPQVDEASRTMSFPFSSEEPCDMWYGEEVLSHKAGAMRQGARQTSMPLLFNHDRDDLLGVCESISLDGNRGIATVRFGKDERGEWAMQQARDGVLVNASFMYRVFKFDVDQETEVYTATDWEPYEVSLVTVPADPTVGVGRSVDDIPNAIAINAINQKSLSTTASAAIKEESMTSATPAAQAAPVVDEAAIRQSVQKDERLRVSEINALCAKHGLPTEARDALIANGNSIEEARGSALDFVTRQSVSKTAVLGNGFAPDLSDKEKEAYSMIRAINAQMSGDWKEAGLEREISQDIAKRMGKSTDGFYMPTNLQFAERAQYAVGALGTGGALVATNLLAGSFIEVLRNKSRVMGLGATVLSGLVGSVDIPRQTAATSYYWVGEGGTLTEAEATFDKVSLSPKHIGTYSMITRQMLQQSTPDIEMLVRADLIAQIALGIDAAALYGSGSGSSQPLGISAQSGIGSVVGGANGAAITIDNLIDLETALANANAPDDSLAYLTNAKVVGALKKLKSTTGQYLWTNSPNGQRSATPGEINGYTVARTNQARSNLTKGTSSGVASEIYFGNWSELLIGEWGVLEIVPNPYDSTAYKQGGILLRAMQTMDIGVRHAASFSVMSDALTS